LAGNRAFVLTNTAADAKLGIHIRLLQPYQDFNPASRRRRWFKGMPAGDL
jgi:hypothetical protein